MDRRYAQALDVPSLARLAFMSPAHFSREFRQVFGETPHRYLQRRRIERACALLRNTDLPVLEVSRRVGFESLGTFGRTFRDVVGRTPTQVRRDLRPVPVPRCFTARWSRPSSFGEAGRTPAPLA